MAQTNTQLNLLVFLYKYLEGLYVSIHTEWMVVVFVSIILDIKKFHFSKSFFQELFREFQE